MVCVERREMRPLTEPCCDEFHQISPAVQRMVRRDREQKPDRREPSWNTEGANRRMVPQNSATPEDQSGFPGTV